MDSLQSPLNIVLVDASYSAAEDPFVEQMRRVSVARQSANLVTLATWPSLRSIVEGREDWTLVWDPATMAMTNGRLAPGFHSDDLQQSVAPASITGDAAIPTIEHQRFVAGPLDLVHGQLYVVETLPLLLANYWALGQSVRMRLDRALTWFDMASRSSGPGAAIVCYIIAVEALLPEIKADPCESCRQSPLKISQRVAKFLQEYAGLLIEEKVLNSLYDMRSHLAHGSQLYEVDFPRFGVNNDSIMDVLKVEVSVRAALLNWLLQQNGQGVG